jgi:hypothetical protein
VVQGPEDVGRALDVEAAPECLLRRQALDDRPLVGVELGLDPGPQPRMSGSVAAAVRITSSRLATRVLAARALRAFSRSWRSGSGSETVSRYHWRSATGYRNVLLVAAQLLVPERAQHAALGLEREVDGRRCHLGLGRDCRDRGCGVALPLEQSVRRLEDRGTRGGRLLAAARGVVAAAHVRLGPGRSAQAGEGTPHPARRGGPERALHPGRVRLNTGRERRPRATAGLRRARARDRQGSARRSPRRGRASSTSDAGSPNDRIEQVHCPG